MSKKSITVNYPVGDFLIRFKNSCLAGQSGMSVNKTNFIYDTAKVLKDMGYISEVKSEKNVLTILIARRRKTAVLVDLKLVSRPGLRIYMNVDELEERRSPSKLIISTPKGVMSAKEAIKKRVGGEVIAEVT